MVRAGPKLQAANGESLKVLGSTNLTFTVNGLTMRQTFCVTDGLNRNFILGMDWLKDNGVRIYFDLGMLRIGKTYVKLQEDCHISSILRLNKKTTIKPQSAILCHVKLNQGFQLTDSKTLEVTNIDAGCIQDEPGLRLREAVNTAKTPHKIPVMIVNETNKCYRLRRGSVIGKARPLDTNEINNVEPMEVDQPEETEEDEIDVPEKHKRNITRLVKKNNDLFAKKDKDLGHTSTVKMRIDCQGHRPLKNRAYRTPLNKRKIIDKAIDEMLEAKVIERSQSPWSFPLVVVKKKDGSDRMCVDFRTLNKIVRPVSFPLPLIDDILSLLGDAKYFTALDLKSGYWQVQLEEDSKEKTAFACHRGLFQFNVMPFGLSNAPAVFQELMNIVLQGCEEFAMAYLDDVLIFSQNPEEHLRHIETIFERMRQHGLKLKLKKCAFFREETEYLGFVISKDGVKPDPKKVEAIRDLPEPKNVREIRGFIGMCSYYRRFVPNFSKIAEPLIDLTKKYARFKWTSECQTAFDFLKESLTVVPLLAYPDTNKPYVLYTDASNHCADLLSRIPFKKGEKEELQQSKSTPEDEELDIDDRSLEIGAINSNEINPRDFASSHVDPPGDVLKPDIDLPEDFNMVEEQQKDEEIGKLKNRMNKGTATKAEQTHYFETEDGLLYYLSQPDSEDPRLRLYIPQEMENIVIKQYHDQLGHMALDKTYDSMRLKYFFPNMYRKLNSYIEKCVTCQTASAKKPRPPLQETDIPPYPFAKMALDLSGPYPTTMSGNRYIVSFIDIYSGWPEAYAVPDKAAGRIVHLILEEIFPRFGCPLEIVSDNGTENVNRKVQETLDAMNIHHIKTSYYCLQANGRVERIHKTLHSVMMKKIQEDVQTWDLYLNQTLAAVRFHVNESSKFSPFFLLYNRDVVLPLDTILKPRKRYVGEDMHKIALQQQHKSFTLVHRHMKEAKRKQKEYADRNSKEENFQIGDPVYLKNHRRTSKLDIKWKGYYRITDQTGPLTFVCRNQLDGTTTKTHARHMRHAKIDEWKVPKDTEGRLLRRTTYVVPPEEESSSEEETTPLQKIVRHKQQERDGSSDEDDIPTMELRRRLRSRDTRQKELFNEDDTPKDNLMNDDNTPKTESETPSCSRDYSDSRPLEKMEIDSIANKTGSLETDKVSETPDNVPPDTKAMMKDMLAVMKATLAL